MCRHLLHVVLLLTVTSILSRWNHAVEAPVGLLGIYRAPTKSSDAAMPARTSDSVSRIERRQAAMKEAATPFPVTIASVPESLPPGSPAKFFR